MTFWEICAYILTVLIVIIVGRIFIKPLGAVLKLILNSVLGGVCLWIFNMLFAGVGFSLALNGVTASVCGILGVPGFVLLVIMKMMFV